MLQASLKKLSESDLEAQILDFLALSRVGFFWKNPSAGFFDGKRFRRHASPWAIRGVPDILGMSQGKFVGFEVKSATGRVSKEQAAFIKKAREHGSLVAVVRSVHQVRQALLEWGLLH